MTTCITALLQQCMSRQLGMLRVLKLSCYISSCIAKMCMVEILSAHGRTVFWLVEDSLDQGKAAWGQTLECACDMCTMMYMLARQIEVLHLQPVSKTCTDVAQKNP